MVSWGLCFFVWKFASLSAFVLRTSEYKFKLRVYLAEHAVAAVNKLRETPDLFEISNVYPLTDLDQKLFTTFIKFYAKWSLDLGALVANDGWTDTSTYPSCSIAFMLLRDDKYLAGVAIARLCFNKDQSITNDNLWWIENDLVSPLASASLLFTAIYEFLWQCRAPRMYVELDRTNWKNREGLWYQLVPLSAPVACFEPGLNKDFFLRSSLWEVRQPVPVPAKRPKPLSTRTAESASSSAEAAAPKEVIDIDKEKAKKNPHIKDYYKDLPVGRYTTRRAVSKAQVLETMRTLIATAPNSWNQCPDISAIDDLIQTLASDLPASGTDAGRYMHVIDLLCGACLQSDTIHAYMRSCWPEAYLEVYWYMYDNVCFPRGNSVRTRLPQKAIDHVSHHQQHQVISRTQTEKVVSFDFFCCEDSIGIEGSGDTVMASI